MNRTEEAVTNALIKLYLNCFIYDEETELSVAFHLRKNEYTIVLNADGDDVIYLKKNGNVISTIGCDCNIYITENYAEMIKMMAKKIILSERH